LNASYAEGDLHALTYACPARSRLDCHDHRLIPCHPPRW
jgi:hypothetical protein